MLDLGEEILRVAVQSELADGVQRVILMRPHLGDVERVEPVVLGLVIGHELHLDGPGRIVAVGNVVEEVLAVDVWVITDDRFGPVSSHVVNTLVTDEVVFHPGDLPFGVNP